VSVIQNLIVAQTTRPIPMKFGRKAQLNPVVKIAIILYPQPWGLGVCVYKTKDVQLAGKIVMVHNLTGPPPSTWS